MDFASDALTTGRALRTLTLIDSYTKESLAIEASIGISSRRVSRVLERVIAERRLPGPIRCENGLEFTSLFFTEWCKDHNVVVVQIQPGKPAQNGYVESFNGRQILFLALLMNCRWFLYWYLVYSRKTFSFGGVNRRLATISAQEGIRVAGRFPKVGLRSGQPSSMSLLGPTRVAIRRP